MSNHAMVATSAARTTTGNSGASVPIGILTRSTNLSILVNCTAVSGTTPSLTLSVEWSHDGTTFAPAETADAFTAMTTTGSKVKTFTIKGDYYRVVWTITGTTPSFTFGLTSYIS